MQNNHLTPTFHYLFITDEVGIGEVFPRLKARLVEQPTNHVSLIYFSAAGKYVFRRELDILRLHFPAQFIPFYESRQTDLSAFVPQETIEVILNENTRDQLHISLDGSDDFVLSAQEQLHFLGVEKDAIHPHFLR
ncbi:hypothetical protein GCM10027347_32470 [Larkinella harenae]